MAKLLALITQIQTPLLAFVNAVMAALIAFNVVLTQTQMGAVDGVVNGALVLIIAVVAVLASQDSTPKPAAP